MAFADRAAYEAARDDPPQQIMYTKGALNTVAGRTFSLWTASGNPGIGAAPTTAAVPASNIAGAMAQLNSSGTQRILRIVAGWASGGLGMLTILDRLSHQGGLSAIVTTAQTTNLPTAALTRYTSGVGVEGFYDITTLIGTTGTTISCTYTDDAGNVGNGSPAVTFGATNNREAGRSIAIPLSVGDRGIRAVGTVTVLATTGTAGAFGVTLAYPLISIPMGFYPVELEALFGMGSWFAKVEADACLYTMVVPNGTSQGVLQAEIGLGEE